MCAIIISDELYLTSRLSSASLSFLSISPWDSGLSLVGEPPTCGGVASLLAGFRITSNAIPPVFSVVPSILAAEQHTITAVNSLSHKMVCVCLCVGHISEPVSPTKKAVLWQTHVGRVCTLSPPSKYNWMQHVRWWCSLILSAEYNCDSRKKQRTEPDRGVWCGPLGSRNHYKIPYGKEHFERDVIVCRYIQSDRGTWRCSLLGTITVDTCYCF